MTLFDPTDGPRVFATPPGVDFSRVLLEGLDARLAGQSPEALARVEIYVNTARTQRRLRALYAARGASFLPRIALVTDLADRPDMTGLPPAIPPLRLRLQLSQLVARLLDREPNLAPRSALYDLSDSLAALMGEMQEEQVSPHDVQALDVGDHSRHWQRSQAFLSIAVPFFAADPEALTVEARQSAVVARLVAEWATAPPTHPILVAGSTGSRGATARFMAAVAALPQGAVVLPGLDFEQPRSVWDGLEDALTGEDHPQFRFAAFARRVGLHPTDIPRWSATAPHNSGRNRLISLALRPAPVTDQWRAEGPGLGDLSAAVAQVTLLEAPTPQIEAGAIALRLRQAAEGGQTAALISPDRVLTRQVAAALDRWRIEPDDSAGEPLGLTAPGRLLRHVAEVFATPVTAEALLVLLKHPLTHSGADRGPHLLRSRDLELGLLRNGVPYPSQDRLLGWAEKRSADPGAGAWVRWVAATVLARHDPAPQSVADHVARHIAATTALAAGPGAEGSGDLWKQEEGERTRATIEALSREAGAGGMMTAAEYRDFLAAVLNEDEARNPVRPHPRIMIWGALEARVQSADLMILAGLNEGVWPAPPGADPWLNRRMRKEAGLRLPDRVIGLSAHDFQLAVAAPEVWLTRSRRDAETETVPSRWLNRLTNLMQGISTGSADELEAMRARGQDWLSMAEALAAPADRLDAAPRPSPSPPVALRPKKLSVTQIEKLVRDPYAIYARKILRLDPLQPLRQAPDAPLRGTILHEILRRFVDETAATGLPADAEAHLLRVTETVLKDLAPWPAARRIWLARMHKIAAWFIAGEAERRARAHPFLREERGALHFDDLDLTLSGTADRIDRRADGALLIYDYKSGQVPTPEQERAFNKQLWLEAIMAEGGGFAAAGKAPVAHIAYVGLGSGGNILAHDVTPADLARARDGFATLIKSFRSRKTGYTSRRAVFDLNYPGDYDHLARYGEWDATTKPTLIEVGS